MIGALCEFSIYLHGFSLNLRFKGIVEIGYIVEMGYMYPIQYEFFFTFKVGKTQFRGLCLVNMVCICLQIRRIDFGYIQVRAFCMLKKYMHAIRINEGY